MTKTDKSDLEFMKTHLQYTLEFYKKEKSFHATKWAETDEIIKDFKNKIEEINKRLQKSNQNAKDN